MYTTTITNERDLENNGVQLAYTSVTERKGPPNRPWRGTGQLSARYITGHLTSSPRVVLSLFLSPLPATSAPYFLSAWITPTTPP